MEQVVAKLFAEGLMAEAAADLRLLRATEALARVAAAAVLKDPALPEHASRSAFTMRLALRLARNRVEPPPAA